MTRHRTRLSAFGPSAGRWARAGRERLSGGGSASRPVAPPRLAGASGIAARSVAAGASATREVASRLAGASRLTALTAVLLALLALGLVSPLEAGATSTAATTIEASGIQAVAASEARGAQPLPAATVERLKQVADSVAYTMLAERITPGLTVAVGHAGEIVFQKGYGLADVENGVAARPETVYRIGSITKQFTSAAVMQMVERGRT